VKWKFICAAGVSVWGGIRGAQVKRNATRYSNYRTIKREGKKGEFSEGVKKTKMNQGGVIT